MEVPEVGLLCESDLPPEEKYVQMFKIQIKTHPYYMYYKYHFDLVISLPHLD